MEEYKGIYYGDESEKKYFEGGAHFKYIKLYQILEKLALEQKNKREEKELYVHKKNKLSNIILQNKKYIDNITKEAKSRNAQHFLNNINSNNTTNNNNKLYYNTAFIKFDNQIKSNEINNNKTNIFIKGKNKIKNQKKIIISRNKERSEILFKARPNTILKEVIPNLLFFTKNNLISNSMEQKKINKKIINENIYKRSFPNINNINNEKKQKKMNSNISFLEVNKQGLKTERNYKKSIARIDNWNKSQNNFNKSNINTNTNNSNVKKLNHNKNSKLFENKNIKERTKSNLNNNIYKNIIEKIKIKKENEGKKEIIVKKQNKKKNMGKKFIGNQLKKIIYNPDIAKENINKILFNSKSKSRNINIDLKENNNSFNIRSNYNIKSRNNNILLNTSKNKDNNKFKTSIKMIVERGKIQNIKQNNIINRNNDNKTVKYNFILNNFPVNKEKMRNKTLNINIINNTCIYIKPKQSQCLIKNKSRNIKEKNDVIAINYTQRPIMKKKKPLIKFFNN